jgi:hypothetical protein
MGPSLPLYLGRGEEAEAELLLSAGRPGRARVAALGRALLLVVLHPALTAGREVVLHRGAEDWEWDAGSQWQMAARGTSEADVLEPEAFASVPR